MSLVSYFSCTFLLNHSFNLLWVLASIKRLYVLDPSIFAHKFPYMVIEKNPRLKATKICLTTFKKNAPFLLGACRGWWVSLRSDFRSEVNPGKSGKQLCKEGGLLESWERDVCIVNEPFILQE